MTAIQTLAQSSEFGIIVSLYELDATALGGSVYYFTNCTLENGNNIVFDGNEYTAVPFKAEGFEMNGSGQQPRPRLTVANVQNMLSPLVNTYNDLLGAKITRIKTERRYLDDGSEPDPTAIMSPMIFFIDQKTAQNAEYIEFELASVMDVESIHLPKRQMIRDFCPHQYRTYSGGAFNYTRTTCPYVGTNYFTAMDQPTTDPAADECSFTLNGCRLRFPNEGLPTWSFPGIGRYQ